MSAAAMGFWLLALLSVATAFAVITNRNPTRSALFLVLNFVVLALLYLTLNAQMLAVLQVLVYAGAIMVLFLFVIMLLNLGGEQATDDPLVGQKPLAAILGLGIFLGLSVAIRFAAQPGAIPAPTVNPAVPPGVATGQDQVADIGRLLFLQYVYPFELTSILLLVGVVGAILLAKRHLGTSAE